MIKLKCMDKPSESPKQVELLNLYKTMATDGYQTRDNEYISVAFSDMEIRAFRTHVKPLFEKFEVKSVLDYGSGGSDYEGGGFSGDLNAKKYFNLDDVFLYEPARDIDERREVDAVICFDVLEHIFISDIPRVIRELYSLSQKILLVNVACYPARALLPTGENAHVTVRAPMWWKGQFDAIATEFPNVVVYLWCSKAWRKVEAFPPFSGANWLNQEGFVATN